MKLAQRWRNFKRPASSKGMWKQFVEDNQWPVKMAEGGVPQLVQPGPGRPGYGGTPVIPSILEELKGTKSTPVDLEAILKKYEITARSSKKNIKDRLIKEGYKIKKYPVSRQVENVIKKLATYESSVDREKLQNLYELIVDANNTDTGLLIKHDKKIADKSASVLMKEAGFGKTMKPGANRFAQELIDRHLVSTKNKMRTALKTMLSNENAAFDGLTKPIEQIAKRFGVKDSVVRTALQDFPFYKQNKEMITRLGHGDFIKKWKGQDLLLADVAELAELKPLRPYFNRGPEGLIQQMAYRHFKAGGNKINFLTHPDQYDPKDWKFEYKGKTYDYLDLARTRDDPNFKSVWKALDDVKNYEEFKITDPKILEEFGYKKPTNLGTIMRRAYGVGTGKKGYFYSRVKDIDHFGNILEEPFENLRALDARTNRAAGHIDLHLSGDEAIKAKKKIGYFNQIDYNDVNAFNQMVDRDLNLARDILIPSERYPTGRKLRTGYNIGKEYAQKTVPKFTPKISGAGELYSFPANLPRMWKMMGSGTRKMLGWLTAGLTEKLFYDWDKKNEMSKGKTEEEAAGIALNNASFGIIPNKKYLPELKKVAKDMGINPQAFEKVYFLNEQMAKVQKQNAQYQQRIEMIKKMPGDPERKAQALAEMEEAYANWQKGMTSQIGKWSEDVAGQIAISKTKLPKPSLDQIAEERYNITDMDWQKPFAEIQMVGEEKLRREKERAYDVQSKLADPESGSEYKWITNWFTPSENFFDLRATGQEKQRLIDDMVRFDPKELYRYNLYERGISPDSPVSKEARENLEYEHPGLGLGQAKGGRVSYLDGGIVSLLKK